MAHTRLHTNIGRTYIRTYGATMAVCQQHCHSATWKKDRRDDSGNDREDEVARYKNNNPKTRKKKMMKHKKAENKELELK